jgi:hypothetical protein
MYIRQKAAFKYVKELIRGIEINRDDMELIRSANHEILRLIKHSESLISKHLSTQKDLNSKIKTGRLAKADNIKLRREQKRVKSYISAQREQIYIWKCFGDSLAFIYLDPLSVKHMYYDTSKYVAKEDAGFISGKIGLNLELKFLNDALDHGVPAVLCDLTNSLRFGDVCLLGQDDPVPIEVKARSRLNQRGRRQVEKLTKLQDFLAADSANSFRGFSGLTRRVTSMSMNYHLESLNTAISKAKDSGYFVAAPEKGITYLVIRTDVSVSEAMSELELDAPEMYDLNYFKNNHSWAPYVPFILSIKDTEDLLDFIEGRIYVIVLLDCKELLKIFSEGGWEVRYRPSDDFSIQCLKRDTGDYFGVSSQFIARAAFEFLSFQSIAALQTPMADFMFERGENESTETSFDIFRKSLLERLSPDDEWFDRILHARLHHSGTSLD